MLILARREGEAIVVTHGDLEIRILVVELRSNRVRLGVAAGRDVTIHREEIHKKILRQKEVGHAL